MPASPVPLDVDAYGDALGAAATVLRENARLAGADAPVPSAPGWGVRDLVLHTGLVHRWADAVLQGVPPSEAGEIDLPVSEGVVDAVGFTGADPFDWYDDQVKALLQTLAFAPDDLEVYFFLPAAPPPRLAWARRQAHETTIHAVDAMGARLHRVPSASQVWFRAAFAVDGIDELLRGFVPRARRGLRSPEPRSLLIRTGDTGHAWMLRISEERVATTAFAPGAELPPYDDSMTGDAVPLYLALWNRAAGDGAAVTASDPYVLARWQEHVRVI